MYWTILAQRQYSVACIQRSTRWRARVIDTVRAVRTISSAIASARRAPSSRRSIHETTRRSVAASTLSTAFQARSFVYISTEYNSTVMLHTRAYYQAITEAENVRGSIFSWADLTRQISYPTRPTDHKQNIDPIQPDPTRATRNNAKSWILSKYNINIMHVVKFILKMWSLVNMTCTSMNSKQRNKT